MKLLIGIPSAGDPAPAFTESLKRLQLPESVTEAEHLTVVGNYVPGARELIAKRAVERGCDLVVMCDDDIVLAADTLALLLETLECDSNCALAGALYYAKDGVRPMVTSRWDPADTSKASVPAFAQTPVSVGGVGFGCVAIRCSALATLTPPYFDAQIFIQQSVAHVRVCNEDYLFCRKLHAHGFDVKLVPRAKCGHVDRATGMIYPATWELPETTNAERMFVLRDGNVGLIPYDDSERRLPEEHLGASLDLIFVP
ncbi:MAG: hypothetical protein JOZ38_11575 [Candidatus Eremiobacteraeota bacterium]|nr:hypothetical protein [Candidatus Eremiobacteraeota bacterium]